MQLILQADGFDFLLPYIKAVFPPKTEFFSPDCAPAGASRAVMLSSCDIYGPGALNLAGEEAPLLDRGLEEAENRFIRQASALGAQPVILRLAPVTATGMTGLVRDLAAEVNQGLFFHFPGNDARMSVVHGTDVANIIAAVFNAAALPQGTLYYNVTDGCDPSVHDLAEALAFRMNEKRISTLSTRPQQIIGKIIFGKRYRRWTTSRTFDGSAIRRTLGVPPVDVCSYLRNHVYDDNSL